MKRQVHVYYSGRVQGVGFRMTADETAHSVGVVGWVKNLRDGRVELVAQGEEPAVEQLLQALRTGPMANFIKDVEIVWGPPVELFKDFDIRY
ncbi:MAG: acylphosphatase [Candidatus Omnitrophica bacterium]|nr:acylphosphatase [Candidatus Omnitrophota bacterium]